LKCGRKYLAAQHQECKVKLQINVTVYIFIWDSIIDKIVH
jgi:hypothetical protein